jgi:signal transduction histidine kinase
LFAHHLPEALEGFFMDDSNNGDEHRRREARPDADELQLELRRTKEELQRTKKELETSNEKLKSLNEALSTITLQLQTRTEDREERSGQSLLHNERKAREEAERAILVKVQLLARLSHELRTPLSSILTWSEMLQHPDLDEKGRQEGLRVIQRSASAQKQLLDDLLDTIRIEAQTT